jgi:predicted phosphoribosyltransferase
MAVGMHYVDFTQTTDAEVQAILEMARAQAEDGDLDADD